LSESSLLIVQILNGLLLEQKFPLRTHSVVVSMDPENVASF
jgi:hypothetical protein